MTLSRDLILHQLRAISEQLRADFGIVEIALFGSYAKGEEDVDSDINLLYKLEPGRHLGIAELFTLEELLKKSLEAEKIDLINQDFLNPLVQDHIESSLVYV